MFVVAINHSVENYEKWKDVYDTFPPTADGAKFARVNRAVDDANNVTVVAGFESLDVLKAFIDDPKLKEAMGEAGLSSEPRIEIYEEVEVI